MKDLTDVLDELDEVIDLLWAAFMAASNINSREGAALSRLLNNIRQGAERARADLDEAQEQDRRNAA